MSMNFLIFNLLIFFKKKKKTSLIGYKLHEEYMHFESFYSSFSCENNDFIHHLKNITLLRAFTLHFQNTCILEKVSMSPQNTCIKYVL